MQKTFDTVEATMPCVSWYSFVNLLKTVIELIHAVNLSAFCCLNSVKFNLDLMYLWTRSTHRRFSVSVCWFVEPTVRLDRTRLKSS